MGSLIRRSSYDFSDALHMRSTVEPLTNDHPHQRPSLSYDHISCDGQWFLFVYESLTSDHPSYNIRPHQCDSEGGRIRGVLLYYALFLGGVCAAASTILVVAIATFRSYDKNRDKKQHARLVRILFNFW